MSDGRLCHQIHIDKSIVIYDNTLVMRKQQTNSTDDLVHITALVRRLFHRMGNAWNGLHKALGVSARMRAVMECLADADKSVPAIASEKEVTRQHIQTIVNELLEANLVHRIENPAHKRSALIALTPEGKKVLATILDREADLLPAIAQHLQHLELRTTADTLAQLLDYFGSDRFNELTERTHRVSRQRRKKS